MRLFIPPARNLFTNSQNMKTIISMFLMCIHRPPPPKFPSPLPGRFTLPPHFLLPSPFSVASPSPFSVASPSPFSVPLSLFYLPLSIICTLPLPNLCTLPLSRLPLYIHPPVPTSSLSFFCVKALQSDCCAHIAHRRTYRAIWNQSETSR